MSLRRILLLALGCSSVLGAVALGCAEDDKTTILDSPDATPDSAKRDTGTGGDDDDDTVDASKDAAKDASDAGLKDANGPGEAGDECAFNRDCQAALRCECDGLCACKPGARGTGQNGITACDSGNDCSSSVCLDGPGDSGQLCTDECVNDSDCPTKLPLCRDIAFVGRVCIRQP